MDLRASESEFITRTCTIDAFYLHVILLVQNGLNGFRWALIDVVASEIFQTLHHAEGGLGLSHIIEIHFRASRATCKHSLSTI